MATIVFDGITAEELQRSAYKLECELQAFNKAYYTICEVIFDFRSSFMGQVVDTFNQRIDGYKNDFAAAEKALKNYITFLRDYAIKMRAEEAELIRMGKVYKLVN